METVVRVSRHRKCSGSVDLIGNSPYGISCYMLSFGDLDNPGLDCEIYLSVFELKKFQEYLKSINIYEIPDCKIKPQGLSIMVNAAKDNLETCTLSVQSLSSQMHCRIWKRNLKLTDLDNTDEIYWILEFSDFHLGYGSLESEYHATQIQIECASFQLSKLRGAINGLLSQIEKKATKPEEKEIDREARDNTARNDRNDREKARKERQAAIADMQSSVPSMESSAHRGSC